MVGSAARPESGSLRSATEIDVPGGLLIAAEITHANHDSTGIGPSIVVDEGYRPVIDEGDAHVGAERTRGHGNAGLRYAVDKTGIELSCHVRSSRAIESGSATFLLEVGGERELRDNEHFSADLFQVQVHFSGLVREAPEPADLPGTPFDPGLIVTVFDAEQDEQPWANLPYNTPVHGDFSPQDSLYDCTHVLAPTLLTRNESPSPGSVSRQNAPDGSDLESLVKSPKPAIEAGFDDVNR
jgi:hypothetical protein